MKDNNNMAEIYLAFFEVCETEAEWDALFDLAYEDASGGGHSCFGNAAWLLFKDGSSTEIPHFGLALRPRNEV